MSIFKKSVNSILLITFLWQSAGIAVAATVRYSGQATVPAIASNNPLDGVFNPMGHLAGMSMVDPNNGLDSEGGINIPLTSNGQIQDPALMRRMLTEITEMAASAPVEMAPQGHNLSAPLLQKNMTNGDARVRSNDAGAIITDLSASTQSDKAFDMTESAPMLWARYYPYRRVGYIQMITLRKKAYTPQFDVTARLNNPGTRAAAIGDAMEIQTEVLGPIDGERLVKGNGSRLPYRGVNPFAAFIGPDAKLYSQISFSAFLTTVGVWGRYYSTQRGFVAVAENRQEKREWNECTLRIFGACLRRRNHVESYVEVRPRWYLMTSAENGIGKSNIMAYASEACRTRATTLPNGSEFDAARETECIVFSGTAFLEASANADIPNEWLKVWHQHYAQSGFTMLFFFLLIMVGGFAFSALIGPIFAGTMEIAVAAVGANLNVVMTIAVIDGLLVAGAYALTTFILQGSGNLSSIQNGLFGSLASGVEIPDISAEGDQAWSPNDCIVSGPTARVPYLYSEPKHRHNGVEPGSVASALPASGCIQWLRNDLNTAPGPVGDFYRARRPNAVRDYTTPNDVKNMGSEDTRPRRFDGAPTRE
jgi:hypothetical protein